MVDVITVADTTGLLALLDQNSFAISQTDSSKPVVGRFAPTPSGRMHLGNVFSLLLAWLGARSANGRIVLRMRTLIREAATFTPLIYFWLILNGLDFLG